MRYSAVNYLDSAPGAPVNDGGRETHPEDNLGHVKSQC